MQHPVNIISVVYVTHDVICVKTGKPSGYHFHPGQATDVNVSKQGWQEELRPFTFTCLPEDDHLEFTIKVYPDHKGVTNEIAKLQKGDQLIIHDVFGDISYKGEGVFIAGGAGVTPFISIFRYLNKSNQLGGNKLVFANRTKADIILEKEFSGLLGQHFINILSDQQTKEYAHGYITYDFLKPLILPGKYVYLCGPPPMMDAVEKVLIELRLSPELLIKEGF